MSSLTVYDLKGAAVGAYEIDDSLLVFDKGEQAVHDVIVATQAGWRGGNASTLQKGEVAGSNKKPWRQKGTGRARAGLRQSPVWRGGGTAFGPKPRDYSKKVNRKVARLAFRRALSDRIKAGTVRLVEDLTVEPKTRAVAGVLKALQIRGTTVLVVDAVQPDLSRASRNLPNVELVSARDLSVYQLVRPSVVVMSRAAADAIKGRLTASN